RSPPTIVIVQAISQSRAQMPLSSPNMNRSPQPDGADLRAPRRTVGFFTACGIVIANIIGTGVFTSLGFQVADIQSGFALLMLWMVALFHFGNLRLGSAFQNLWTIVKLLLVGVLIGAGLLIEEKQPFTFFPHAADTMSIFSGAFAVALVYVMYSYSGWNASSYI